MKIVYFNYLDNAIGPLIRTLELAKACADNGMEVALYCMSRHFKPPAFVFERIRAYQSDKLRIHYATRFESAVVQQAQEASAAAAPRQAPGEPRSRSLGLLKQSLLSLRHVREELAILRAEKPDAVVARPDHALSFCLSARWAGVPLVLDTDGPVEELALYWGIRSRIFPWMDTLRARCADSVLVISRVCEELLRAKLPANRRFYIVPNGTHAQEFAPSTAQRRQALRQQLGLRTGRVIGYSGNQRVWHGLPHLLRASRPLLMADPTLSLLIIGCGFNPALQQECDIPPEVFRQQVIFTGPLSYWDMAAHIDLADLMVMPYARLPLFYFSPMRMFEALSLGKSLITSCQGQMQDLLDASQTSVRFFDTQREDSLREVLAASIADDDFIDAGQRNRAFLLREHTWQARGATVRQAVEDAIRRHPSSVAP